MEGIKISFVIPVYNVEQYLNQCIDSIINQSYRNIEVVLIDDGSMDNSPAICDRYAELDERIIVVHQTNSGASAARNTGILKTSGDYILFVDSDDFINRESLQDIVKTIERNNRPDIVFLEHNNYYDSKEEVGLTTHNGIGEEINSLSGEKLFYYLSNRPKYSAAAWQKVIKRELFLNNDLFFENGLYAEDLEWAVRLYLKCNNAAYCPVEYYYYRTERIGSISKYKSEKKAFDVLYIFNKWTDYASELESGGKKQMICSFMEYVFRTVIMCYLSVSEKSKKNYKEGIRKGEWVLGIRKDKASQMIRLSYKLLGVKLSARLLQIYLLARTKWRQAV